MRFKSWLALVVSLAVLFAIGAVGWQMNSAAQQTAESIHRNDTAKLVRNNATLASQYLLLSAKELADFGTAHALNLRAGDPADRQSLQDLRAKSVFFRYGAALTDLTGTVANADAQEPGLPPMTDPGYAALRRGLLAGQPGFSSVMTVAGVPLAAVAVPVMSGGVPRAILIGYTKVAASQLQAYLSQLGGDGEVGAILDSTGVFAATSDVTRLGTQVEPAVEAAIAKAAPMRTSWVEFTHDGRRTIAFITTGMQGNWVSYKSWTESTFYGQLRSSGQRTNLSLLGIILVAAAALSLMYHRVETVRRRTEEHFRALVQNAMDVVTVLGPNGAITYDSPSVTTVLGYPPGARQGTLGASTLHPDDQEHAREVFADVLDDPTTIQRMQCRVVRADGSYLWTDLSVTNLLANPAIGGIVVNARDVSESRRLQEQMSHQALHDPLTGLPNRRMLSDRLGAALRREDVPTRLLALIFIDLDRFKPVNDLLGHDAGDELLRQVSQRFLTCLRPMDTLARVGGDEFVILIDQVGQLDDAARVADRLLVTLDAPSWVFGNEVRVGASVGITLAHAGEEPEEVLRRADSAMYVAKQSGGLRYEVCKDTPAMA